MRKKQLQEPYQHLAFRTYRNQRQVVLYRGVHYKYYDSTPDHVKGPRPRDVFYKKHKAKSQYLTQEELQSYIPYINAIDYESQLLGWTLLINSKPFKHYQYQDKEIRELVMAFKCVLESLIKNTPIPSSVWSERTTPNIYNFCRNNNRRNSSQVLLKVLGWFCQLTIGGSKVYKTLSYR